MCVFFAEDFNKKILNPDLSQQDLEKLHRDLCDLYKNYLAPTAPDRIKFEESIVTELEESMYGKIQDACAMFTICDI